MNDRIMARLSAIEPRALLLMMVCVLAILLFEGWLQVLRQPMSDYLRLKGERAAQVQPRSEPPRVQAEIGRLEGEVAALAKKLQGQSAQRPVDQMVVAIIDRLDHIAVRRGVRLDSARQGATRRVLMFDEVSTDIKVTGKYAPLFEWLRDAEAELAPLVITQFSMKRTDTASGTLAMELKLAEYRPVTTGAARQ